MIVEASTIKKAKSAAKCPTKDLKKMPSGNAKRTVFILRYIEIMESKIFFSNRSVFYSMFANWARAQRANIGRSRVWMSNVGHQIVAILP